MNLGSIKFRLVFSPPLLAQGSPLVEFIGIHKIYDKVFKSRTVFRRVGMIFEPETLAGRELTDQL